MNKKHLSLIILFIGAGLFNLNAQDAKAKTILDQLSKKTATYKSMKASFEYQMLNKDEGIDETQTGSLISKGNQYHLNIAGQEIVSDGKTVWTILAEVEEVQINTVSEEDEDEFVSPTKILTLWEKGFKYKYDKASTLNSNAVDIINLYPENADDKSFHTIKLFVNKSTTVIDQIIIKGKDGTDFIYKIVKFESNIPLSDESFRFSSKDHPEFDVIDLR